MSATKHKPSLYDKVLGDMREPLSKLAFQKERSVAYMIREAVKQMLLKEGIIKTQTGKA